MAAWWNTHIHTLNSNGIVPRPEILSWHKKNYSLLSILASPSPMSGSQSKVLWPYTYNSFGSSKLFNTGFSQWCWDVINLFLGPNESCFKPEIWASKVKIAFILGHPVEARNTPECQESESCPTWRWIVRRKTQGRPNWIFGNTELCLSPPWFFKGR